MLKRILMLILLTFSVVSLGNVQANTVCPKVGNLKCQFETPFKDMEDFTTGGVTTKAEKANLGWFQAVDKNYYFSDVHINIYEDALAEENKNEFFHFYKAKIGIFELGGPEGETPTSSVSVIADEKSTNMNVNIMASGNLHPDKQYKLVYRVEGYSLNDELQTINSNWRDVEFRHLGVTGSTEPVLFKLYVPNPHTEIIPENGAIYYLSEDGEIVDKFSPEHKYYLILTDDEFIKLKYVTHTNYLDKIQRQINDSVADQFIPNKISPTESGKDYKYPLNENVTFRTDKIKTFFTRDSKEATFEEELEIIVIKDVFREVMNIKNTRTELDLTYSTKSPNTGSEAEHAMKHFLFTYAKAALTEDLKRFSFEFNENEVIDPYAQSVTSLYNKFKFNIKDTHEAIVLGYPSGYPYSYMLPLPLKDTLLVTPLNFQHGGTKRVPDANYNLRLLIRSRNLSFSSDNLNREEFFKEIREISITRDGETKTYNMDNVSEETFSIDIPVLNSGAIEFDVHIANHFGEELTENFKVVILLDSGLQAMPVYNNSIYRYDKSVVHYGYVAVEHKLNKNCKHQFAWNYSHKVLAGACEDKIVFFDSQLNELNISVNEGSPLTGPNKTRLLEYGDGFILLSNGRIHYIKVVDVEENTVKVNTYTDILGNGYTGIRNINVDFNTLFLTHSNKVEVGRIFLEGESNFNYVPLTDIENQMTEDLLFDQNLYLVKNNSKISIYSLRD